MLLLTNHHVKQMILRGFIFIIVAISGSSAYADESHPPLPQHSPTTYEELLQLYKHAINAGEKIKIPDDILERARDEIQRVGTWEYQVVTLKNPQDSLLEKRLNALGKDRWECQVGQLQSEQVRILCKRPTRTYLKNIAITDLLKLIP